MEELENIDDECDALGITFVKIDNADEAKEYGIDKVPKLLYFEKGIPTVYEGKLENEEDLLKWLEQQTTSDEIEDITDEMLDLIIEKMPYVAVLFCKIYILIYNLMIEILIFFFIYLNLCGVCTLNLRSVLSPNTNFHRVFVCYPELIFFFCIMFIFS